MRRPTRDGERDAGMSTLEVVLLSPLVIGFVLFLVCFGVLVNARGSVEGAARDAARMGSLQRDARSAGSTAQATAVADLGNTCQGTPTAVQVNPTTKAGPYSAFGPGQLYTIKVTCVVSLSGLDWFNIGRQTIIGYSTAPLDTFRRTN